MFHKDFEIDNSEGFSHLRISSVPHFDFFLNLTVVQLYKSTSDSLYNLLVPDKISSDILNGSDPAKHHYFDIPLEPGKYKVSVTIAQMNGIKDVNDITANLINHQEEKI